MRLNQAGLILAAVLAACSPGAAGSKDAAATSAAPAARHPVSGLPVIPLTVAHDGKTHSFMVEVARSRDEQAKGLMFRTAMGADEGMLFPMDPPRPASFWMRNTVISLDIIFIGTDGRVLNVAAETKPYSEEPVPSAGPVKAVLELNAGRAAELGIGPGAVVSWSS